MIHDAPAQATWADDEIIFVQDFSLYRISENGGQRDLVAGLDPPKGIARYGHPHSLPGGKAVLVEIWGDTGDRTTEGIYVVPLDTGQPTIVAEQGMSPTYATTGHTVYARQDGTLEAVPFDPERLEKLGPAVRVRQGVFVPGDHAAYTLSEGQLVYVPAPAASRRRTQIVWVDRQGNETMIANEQQLAQRDTNSAGLPFDAVRLSPDGTRIAAGSGGLVWLLGIGDGTLNPLGEGGAPLWTRGGEKVLFSSQGAIYRTDSDFSSSEPELLLRTGGFVFPISLSEDGKQLLLHEQIAITQQRRIGMMSIDGDREVTYPLDVRGELNQRTPMFSPEDHWVAYVSPSPQTGRSEVWVVSFPDWDSRHPVSNAGGYSPMWGRDETELFYIEDQRMILAHLETGPDFGVLDRDVLFQVTYFEKGVGYRTLHDYDPVTDRFLMVKNMDIEEVLLTVVVNWFEELKQLVPTGGSQ